MSYAGIQFVIGRLLTDEEFRYRFEKHRRDSLDDLGALGITLSDSEKAVLMDADGSVWSKLAARIDPRLQQARVRLDAVHGRTRPLTDRERQVLRRVFDGLSNKQISADLHTSETAIKATLQRVFKKMHVRTRGQLVRIAIETLLGANAPRP